MPHVKGVLKKGLLSIEYFCHAQLITGMHTFYIQIMSLFSWIEMSLNFNKISINKNEATIHDSRGGGTEALSPWLHPYMSRKLKCLSDILLYPVPLTHTYCMLYMEKGVGM